MFYNHEKHAHSYHTLEVRRYELISVVAPPTHSWCHWTNSHKTRNRDLIPCRISKRACSSFTASIQDLKRNSQKRRICFYIQAIYCGLLPYNICINSLHKIFIQVVDGIGHNTVSEFTELLPLETVVKGSRDRKSTISLNHAKKEKKKKKDWGSNGITQL